MNKKHVLSFCTLFFSLSLSSICYNATFIFDLGGVLVRQSNFMSCWNIGIPHFFGFYNPFGLEKQVFAFLDLLEEQDPCIPITKHNSMRVPQLMVDWLCGKKTSTEIKYLIQQGMIKYNCFFSTNHQKKLIKAITSFMFTPNKLIDATYPIADGIKIIKHLYKQTDAQGKQLHKIIILSNWDNESIELLFAKIPQLSQYSHGALISGYAGCAKPNPTFFKAALKKFNLDPAKEHIIYIDDQAENIAAANTLGLNGIQCTKLSKIKKQLKQLNLW